MQCKSSSEIPPRQFQLVFNTTRIDKGMLYVMKEPEDCIVENVTSDFDKSVTELGFLEYCMQKKKRNNRVCLLEQSRGWEHMQ
mmetsp:Transcript_26263/g.55443  ORF Transcript_26263/g.55443 Transcript_26263/m.55443 type:complete len:83 (-) Transcript_26263:272-520(-)